MAIIDKYLDNPEATQICAAALLRELQSRGICITVIALNSKAAYSEVDGVKVYEFVPFGQDIDNDNRVPFSCLNSIIGVAREIVKRIPSCFKGYLFPEPFLSLEIRDSILDVCRGKSVDILISFSAPFHSHELAAVLKTDVLQNTTWVAFEMDPFAFNYTLPRAGRPLRKRHEQKVLREANLIMTATGISEENYRRGYLKEYSDKTLRVSLPGYDGSQSLERLQKPFVGIRDGVVRFLYAGVFYRTIRSPRPLFETLSASHLDYEIVFCGNIHEKDLKGYEKVLRRSKFMGYVSQDEVEEQCAMADILIDVQNSIPNQVPSKVLTYMASGRPIVSFYKRGCEAGLEYIRNYPCKILLEDSEARNPATIDAFDSFCGVSHPTLTRREIEEAMKGLTTSDIADNMLGALGLSEWMVSNT